MLELRSGTTDAITLFPITKYFYHFHLSSFFFFYFFLFLLCFIQSLILKVIFFNIQSQSLSSIQNFMIRTYFSCLGLLVMSSSTSPYDSFGLRRKEREQSRVNLAQNQLISSKLYFTPLHSPSFISQSKHFLRVLYLSCFGRNSKQ